MKDGIVNNGEPELWGGAAMTQRLLVALALVSLSAGALGAQVPPAAESVPLVQRPKLKPSTEKLVVSFPENVGLQQMILEIGQRAGVTILFDEAFRDQTTGVNLGTVSVEDALEKLTLIHRLFYKILDPTTVIIIPDNAQKHRQYDDMLLHTFYVEHSDVNGIANMFRTIAGIQRVQPDPTQKSVTVRATADQLLVAQSVLDRNDAPPAELAFQVDVLAVDLERGPTLSLALSSQDYLRFKGENDTEVLLSQTIRLTENERAGMSIEEGAQRPLLEPSSSEAVPSTDEQTKPETPAPQRAVGIHLSLSPQASTDDKIRLSIALQATVPAGKETSTESASTFVRTREVNTTVSLRDGETTLFPVMVRVDELGGALANADTQGAARHVVIAIGASMLRPAARLEIRPPLPMGTEQLIRVPRP